MTVKRISQRWYLALVKKARTFVNILANIKYQHKQIRALIMPISRNCVVNGAEKSIVDTKINEVSMVA